MTHVRRHADRHRGPLLITNQQKNAIMKTEISFENEFMRKHPDRGQIVAMMRESFGKPDGETVGWADLTTFNLTRFRDLVCDRVAGNSACTYLAIVKSFLSVYAEECGVPCKTYQKVLKAKHVPSQHIALTEEEVMLIDGYRPKSDTERDVKILFMRGCLTGARSSDCKRFDGSIVSGGFISYVSQKTKTEVSQPMHVLLAKYLEMQPSKTHNAGVCNSTIRRICRNIGLNDTVTLFVGGAMQTGPKWKFVSMHTSRRTFCSCLALRDVPIGTISKLVGHRSTAVTDRYICIDTRKPGDKAMAFFNAV